MSNYLSTREVADLLGMSPHTINRWRYEGTGPKFVRIGSKVCRYRAEDVEQWINEQEEGNNVE